MTTTTTTLTTATAALAAAVAAHGSILRAEGHRWDLATETGAGGYIASAVFDGVTLRADRDALAEAVAAAVLDAVGLDGYAIDADHEQAAIDLTGAIIALDAALSAGEPARIHGVIASIDREDAENGRGSYIDGLRDVEISAENVSANMGAHIEEKLRADDEHETLTDAQREAYEAAHAEYWNYTEIWAEIVKLDLDRATAAFAD